MMSKIWVGISTTTKIFISFNSKFKVNHKNGDFESCYIRTHSLEKTSTVLTLHLLFCIFFIKMLLTKLPSWYLRIYFALWNHQIHFKMVYSSPKKAKCRSRVLSIASVFLAHSPFGYPWRFRGALIKLLVKFVV